MQGGFENKQPAFYKEMNIALDLTDNIEIIKE